MGGGWGESGQVILVGPELFRFPRVWEGLGIQLGVAEHLLELGVVKWAVDGGIDISLGVGRGRSGQWGGVRGGTRPGGRASWYPNSMPLFFFFFLFIMRSLFLGTRSFVQR